MRAILSDSQGNLAFGKGSVRPVGDKDVRIKVVAAGVNRADLLQKTGKYPPPPGASSIIGLEVSGEVIEVGTSVKRFTVGDKVMGLLAGGGYAEEVVDDESIFINVPSSLELAESAAIPEVFLTAYQALFALACLDEGETVLIHAGASGVGTAAIQLAKRADAKVIVTAGSDEKLAFCETIGADLTINYKEDDFVQVINERDEYAGVDVVIDPIGGDYFGRNLDLLNTDGRYVLLAFMGGAKSEINLAKVLRKRIHLMGTTLRARSVEYKSGLIAGFEDRFLGLFDTGQLKPVIDQIYDWTEVEKAHDCMNLNKNIGKLLLRVS